MQNNSIKFKIIFQELKNQRTNFINNEYHIYADRKDIRPKDKTDKYYIKDYRWQTIFLGTYINKKPVYLHIRKQRYISKNTGKIITSTISLVNKYDRISNIVKDNIKSVLKEIKSYKQIGKENNVSTSTVIRIIEEIKIEERRDKERVLFIDEFRGNIDKQKYQLVVYGENHNLIDVYKNRNQDTLENILKNLKPENLVIDMFKPFKNIINKILPNSQIIADKYHVIRQGIWTLRDVRIEIFNSNNKENKEYKKYWKIIQKNPKNLSEKEKKKIEDLKNKNSIFKKCYELIEKFYNIFEIKIVEKFKEELEKLIEELKESEIRRCVKLGKTLKTWFDEVVNIIKFNINNGFVEGYNNKIKVIKRVGYGYRNYNRFRKLIHLRLQQ